MTEKPPARVPCNGCTACCKGEAIILHPECGDDESLYQTKPVQHPLTGKMALMLEQKSNGDCAYLGTNGCTIWGHRPTICRTFDCRMMFLKFPPALRKQMLRAGMLDRDVIRAGRKRQNTLTDEQRKSALVSQVERRR